MNVNINQNTTQNWNNKLYFIHYNYIAAAPLIYLLYVSVYFLRMIRLQLYSFGETELCIK